MQQFSLVYNNLLVFLEPVDEPWPTYDCGELMQGSSRDNEILLKKSLNYGPIDLTTDLSLDINTINIHPSLGMDKKVSEKKLDHNYI